MHEGTPFLESVKIQWRVVRALLMREMITRYGRHNIGFFWMFGEPALFCGGVILIRIAMKEQTRGLPIVEYVLTGYSAVLLWRNCGNRCCNAITPNFSLLYHRNVRSIDFLIARIILEVAGCAMAFILLTISLVLAGAIKPPNDWTLLMEGYMMMCWYAASIGTFVCACSELSEVFEKIWHPICYFMLPICGLFFMVAWLPLKYQKLALLVPMVNGSEMIRDGYFGNQVRCYYSVPYLSCWCLGLMLVGLCLLKVFARKAEPQ